jgi:phosphotriesterase-related protein
MKRRSFLAAAASVAPGLRAAVAQPTTGESAVMGRIITVQGPIPAKDLGVTLPHEHVMVDFIGADQVSPDRYDRDEVVRVAAPYLEAVQELGMDSLVECTPDYIGRDPVILRRLSEELGVHLLTNTGYYGAANDKFVPQHAFEETSDQLAARWIDEAEKGIGDTGVFPGFIKVGVDAGPLSEIDRKIVIAAAKAHQETGLPVACHTGDGAAAKDEITTFAGHGGDPSRFIWVHAQLESDPEVHAWAAEQGVWVEFDGIAPNSIEQHVKLVSAMNERGLLGKVLVSHDAGWYWVGEPGGGNYRGYETLFTGFIPALKETGLTGADTHALTVTNPAKAFSVKE